ncbi:MAG TPA: ATP-binding protein, partial [Acidimicrobiales bacterium]|nr:ATP-binding protein [Acidimicrobiales bacterium]
LPHVFERHFTSDRVPSRHVGTGLGLAIVAELTAAMSGVVRADSPVVDARGTRMTLWLPRGQT